MISRWRAFFRTPSALDPDDSRRRRTLDTLLSVFFVLTIAGLLLAATIFGTSGSGFAPADLQVIFISGPVLLLIIVIIYFVNRRVSGQLASTLFLLFLLVLFVFTDSPEEVSNGRTLFVFAIPIVISSLLLRPWASFIFAALGSLEISLLADLISQTPNSPAIIGFFLLASVSWLSARSLEQALRELRQINVELDRRVDERTRALSAALSREMAEAGKNQAILESIADGVVVFDTKGVSMVANHAMEGMLSVPHESLIEVPIEQIFSGKTLAQTDLATIRSILTHSQQGAPSVRFRFGGRTLLANSAPVRSGDGNEIGTVAVFRDFTREAEVEQMKNTFVAMVSHELRTPLNAILGYAEMVRESVYGPLSPPQATIMQRIEASSRRLLDLVSDLLDEAQIEAGRMRIHIEEFNTADLREALQSVIERQARDKNLAFHIEVSPQMPARLRGDPRRIQQVLINLAGNAIKFTQKGAVNIRFYMPDSANWAFDVQDSGPGISMDAQEYIFDTFRQADHGATREHGGVGLGLSIVRSLTTLMGGNVSVRSKIGQGSTFIVTLPMDPTTEEK